MSAPTDELKEKIRQLESDEAFLELSKKYNALNLFEILKITKAEIRHSNFLAWLLDPKGNHRLQDRFLRAFAANLGQSGSVPQDVSGNGGILTCLSSVKVGNTFFVSKTRSFLASTELSFSVITRF